MRKHLGGSGGSKSFYPRQKAWWNDAMMEWWHDSVMPIMYTWFRGRWWMGRMFFFFVFFYETKTLSVWLPALSYCNTSGSCYHPLWCSRRIIMNHFKIIVSWNWNSRLHKRVLPPFLATGLPLVSWFYLTSSPSWSSPGCDACRLWWFRRSSRRAEGLCFTPSPSPCYSSAPSNKSNPMCRSAYNVCCIHSLWFADCHHYFIRFDERITDQPTDGRTDGQDLKEMRGGIYKEENWIDYNHVSKWCWPFGIFFIFIFKVISESMSCSKNVFANKTQHMRRDIQEKVQYHKQQIGDLTGI